MANKLALSFGVMVRGDGSSNTLTIALGAAPVFYTPASGALSDAFAATSTDAVNLSGDWADAVVTKTSLIAGVLTLGLNGVPIPDGTFHVIYGTLIF